MEDDSKEIFDEDHNDDNFEDTPASTLFGTCTAAKHEMMDVFSSSINIRDEIIEAAKQGKETPYSNDEFEDSLHQLLKALAWGDDAYKELSLVAQFLNGEISLEDLEGKVDEEFSEED